jgi:hypothetical protein
MDTDKKVNLNAAGGRRMLLSRGRALTLLGTVTDAWRAGPTTSSRTPGLQVPPTVRVRARSRLGVFNHHSSIIESVPVTALARCRVPAKSAVDPAESVMSDRDRHSQVVT